MSVQLVSARIRELAKQPFIRPRNYHPWEGWGEFDMQWALSVWDARERVQLEELANANPGQNVRLPNDSMGYCPNERTA